MPGQARSAENKRVIQKNMVYISGPFADLEDHQLQTDCYFGSYGRILKVSRAKSSLYLTFSDEVQAALAIEGVYFDEKLAKTVVCLFGTSKYCKYFLKKTQCKHIDKCPFLHLLEPKNQVWLDKNEPLEAIQNHHRQIAQQIIVANHSTILVRYNQFNDGSGSKRYLPQPMTVFNYLNRSREVNISESVSNQNQSENKDEENKIQEEKLNHKICLNLIRKCFRVKESMLEKKSSDSMDKNNQLRTERNILPCQKKRGDEEEFEYNYYGQDKEGQKTRSIMLQCLIYR